MIVGVKLAAEIAGVKTSTIRQWVHRGQINRHASGGVNVDELIEWLDRRDHRALARRAGLRGEAGRSLATGGNRAARLVATAQSERSEIVSVTPNAIPDTPDYGGWLRPRRI